MSSSSDESVIDARLILEPVIRRVVDALGGIDSDQYRLGDSASACLSDLKKLWRKDDTDDDRTVARIFFATLLLPNDLVSILLTTAGKGLVEDPRALKCADLICAMTWPIDVAEELKELDDDDLDGHPDYTELTRAHLTYKAALLKPGVMQSLFGLALPPLARPHKERTPRDAQIVGIVLYIVRNLLFITDPPADTRLSADRAEYAGLQGRLVKVLHETNITDLLLTIAANEGGDRMFEGWNTVVLEIFYLLYRGVKPAGLAADQAKQPAENLHRLLLEEDKSRREIARKASSRHSRFGTTISVKLNPSSSSSTTAPVVLHRQQALTSDSGSILDLGKKAKAKSGGKGKDELGREDNLGVDAKKVLQHIAKEFIKSSFNSFLAGLLKDIKSERPKITEKDNLRLLFVTKWFLEFFLAARKRKEEGEDELGFGLIAEVTERGWIVWVLKRMRGAVEEKPKQWTELQAGIECLTQLLLLIDALSSPSHDTDLVETARLLQHQLIYNGEVLDLAFESLKGYREGTQSLVYLEASVELAWAVLRGVERAGKEEVYVRKRKARRKKGKGKATDGEDEDEGEGEDDEVITETMFTFEAFEMKLANAEITATLLTYLSRYKEFKSPECMKRVVSLLHRQAVRAKAEGLFFKVSTLDLFKSILADQRSMPRDQPYKDLINLINFILKKFFKALDEEPFLAIEAFFPKNRGHWKAYSSYTPEEKERALKDRGTVEDTRFPQDVQVKKGYSWSQQVGIAVQALVDDGKLELVNWVKDILTLVSGIRERIVEETDSKDDDDDDHIEVVAPKLPGPSADAISKFTDYLIPYISDEQAEAATKNPQLKLLFKLVKFYTLDEDTDELEWYVPAAIVPRELESSLTVINQFLETPIDLDGKKAAQLLSKKARRRRRRHRSPSADDSNDDDDEPRRKRKEKKKKEKENYKSAQFIEDSDEEYGDMEAFLEKERELREKAALAAAESGKIGTMKATGTKKRRRKMPQTEKGGKKKKRKGDEDAVILRQEEEAQSEEESDAGIFGELQRSTSPPSRPRPRPKPRFKGEVTTSSPGREASAPLVLSDEEESPGPLDHHKPAKKGRLVISDEE